MSDIVNRVAQSTLITFNLEDYYPEGERRVLDIKKWLFEDLILKEKEFRAYVSEMDWSQFSDKYVAIHCSSDAIIPGWAYMLISSKLQPFAKKVVLGNLEDLESAIFQPIIENLDVSSFQGKPIIVKGCTNKPIPTNAYMWITSKLQTVAKSLMYGEACSAVPLYKQR